MKKYLAIMINPSRFSDNITSDIITRANEITLSNLYAWCESADGNMIISDELLPLDSARRYCEGYDFWKKRFHIGAILKDSSRADRESFKIIPTCTSVTPVKCFDHYFWIYEQKGMDLCGFHGLTKSKSIQRLEKFLKKINPTCTCGPVLNDLMKIDFW